VNRGDQPVTFRHSDAQRIANAVAAHESGRRDRKSSQLPRAAGGGSGGGVTLVTATFLGSWFTGQYKPVNFDGHHYNWQSTNTALCFNQIMSFYGNGATTPRVCIVSPSTSTAFYMLVNGGDV
jgi:hypothetical protein